MAGEHPSRVHRRDTRFEFKSADVSNRLAYLAFFYVVGFTLAYGSGIVAGGHLGWKLLRHPQTIVALVCIVGTIAVFVMARWRLLADTTLTRIALIWIAPAVLGILVAENWIWMAINPEVFELGMAKKTNFGISWACVTISIFPLLVHASVFQVGLASLAAAAMGPLYMLGYSMYLGLPLPEGALFGVTFPLSICVGIAIAGGAVMAHYRRDVDRARRLGSYQLEDRLGKGGMGEVWRARHHMLVRPAAIKLISPDALCCPEPSNGSPSAIRRRFEREVQATASLKSPHTISVYDFGTTDEGSFYYVMELLDGLDAQSLVERFGPLPEGRVVNLLMQACDSLAEAHHNGLIHRDIKPANLFICRQGLRHDFVKVLDFGLVRTAEDVRPEETRLTAEGVATGTPAYMPPEVATAKPDLDARLDIYSLGCVAYWLLTGQEVFEADSPMALVLKHVQEPPEPPSKRSELEISTDLDDLITSCLAKTPGDRPQSASDLMTRLSQCKVNDPWDRSRSQAWWDKHLPTT